MIVAAIEKKKSLSKCYEAHYEQQSNASPDRHIMYVSGKKKELNVVQMKRASTWPWPKRQCSGDLSSLLVRWPAWRGIFMFSDDHSVCDSGLAPGGCENFDASRTVSLIAANLGSKDLQVRSLSWQRKFRRGGNVLSLAAVAHFLAVGLESVRGMGGQWRCWTPRLWPESRRSRKIIREVHNQEVVVRYLQESRDQTHWSSGILVEQEEDLGANSCEKVDLLLRAIARASRLLPFSDMRRTPWTSKDKKCLSEEQQSCAMAQWFSGIKSNTVWETWERCMTSRRMTGMWRSSRRTRHTSSIRVFERGHCAQCPS